MSDVIRERLLKVLRLAQQGVGGEKENAEVLLEKLCRKHGIRREMLEHEQEERHFVWHPYGRGEYEKDLLCCVARGICQRRLSFSVPRGSRKRVLGFEATPAEHAAILVLQEQMAKAWKSAKTDLLVAFAFKHRLAVEQDDDDDRESSLDPARAQRLMSMMDALEEVPRPNRRITARAGR